MDWNEIILTVVSILFTALATWGIGILKTWLNIKLKDKTALKYINNVIDTVDTVVKFTYQTYVESIKGSELWDEVAQKEALNKALICAKAQLSSEAKEYLSENFNDLDEYLKNKIESAIYDLKRKKQES